jgi:hypothetical protein
MVLLVLVLRGARRGLSSFGGEGAGARAFGIVVWILASLDFLFAWAALLRRTTHHHALAGATFALVGLGICAALAVLVRRAVVLASGWTRPSRNAFFFGILAALAVALLYGAGRALATPSLTAGLLVDVLAFGIAGGFASRASFVRRRLATIGPPLAVLVVALGLAALRAPSVAVAVGEHAPLLAAPVGLASELVRGR